MAEQFKAIGARSGVEALSKGLSLFHLIAADEGRTRVSELAAGLKMPRTTVHRLLCELLRHRMILRVGHGRYAAGIVFAEVEPSKFLNQHLTTISRPYLEQLAAAHECTAHLGVLENSMVTYLIKIGSTSITTDFTKENEQIEAYCSGIGKVLLSCRSDGFVEDYLSSAPFIAFTDRTITAPEDLARCLRKVRERGWASDDGEAVQGLQCLAVPISRPGQQPVGAISISSADILAAHSFESTTKRLIDCARNIAAQL